MVKGCAEKGGKEEEERDSGKVVEVEVEVEVEAKATRKSNARKHAYKRTSFSRRQPRLPCRLIVIDAHRPLELHQKHRKQPRFE